MSHLAAGAAVATSPLSWSRTRLKAVCERREERRGSRSIELLSLASAGYLLPRSKHGDRQQPSDDSLPRYLVVKPDDLVVNPMWLTGGSVAVSGLHGAVSPDYRVFRPSSVVHPRYLHHVLRSEPYFEQYRLYARAETTFDRRVQQEDLDQLPLALPPLDEQRRIADFLDDQVARIDAAVEGCDGQLRLVGEGSARRLFDLYSVDEWSLVPLSALARIVDTEHRTAPETPDGAHWSAGTGSIRDGRLIGHKLAEIDLGTFREWTRRGIPSVGDVLLTREAPVGEVAVVGPDDLPLAIGQRVVLIKPNGERLDSRFLSGFLLSEHFERWVVDVTQGSLHPHLNMSDISRMRVPQPSMCVQYSIGQMASDLLAESQALGAAVQDRALLLFERKRALITAAVTGAFDVSLAGQRTAVHGVGAGVGE